MLTVVTGPQSAACVGGGLIVEQAKMLGRIREATRPHLRVVSWLLRGPFLAVVASAGAEDWPQFRGPAGTGVSADAPIPLEWSSGKHICIR